MINFTNKELATALRLEIDSKITKEPNRPYLGMSQIGHSCSRYLWYYFRWVKQNEYDARKMRIFSRGHHEEPRLIKMLEGIGAQIVSNQMAVSDCEGHFRGHSDAVVTNLPNFTEDVLCEFKAVNEKSWKKFDLNGLVETNKQYYAQVQLYMFYNELQKTVFIAVNKNTEELYIEVVDLDMRVVEKLQMRAMDIINIDMAPQRAFDTPTYYECNWCDYKKICWENDNYAQNCRTCKYSEPSYNGNWRCTLQDIILEVEAQRLGCDSYDSMK